MITVLLIPIAGVVEEEAVPIKHAGPIKIVFLGIFVE
jgi:hypothetical protein